jgi:hypothetical protein
MISQIMRSVSLIEGLNFAFFHGPKPDEDIIGMIQYKSVAAPQISQKSTI